MAVRSGPLGTGAKILFALPFIAAGVFAAYRAFLDRTASGVIFGAIFVAVGLWQVRLALRAARSSEELAGKGLGASTRPSDVMPVAVPPAGYRTPAASPRSAREAYGPWLATLPVPKLRDQRGHELPFALGLRDRFPSLALVAIAVVRNAVALPIFAVTLAVGSWLGMFVSGMGSAVTLLFFFASVSKLLARRKLPTLELDCEPGYLGDNVVLGFFQRGPARIIRLEVQLVCEERVRYTVGTDTRTEQNVVYSCPVIDEVGVTLASGESFTRRVDVTLPKDQPHSFKSANNEIAWMFRARAEIDAWPDYKEDFVFRALPRLES